MLQSVIRKKKEERKNMLLSSEHNKDFVISYQFKKMLSVKKMLLSVIKIYERWYYQ